ncbi:far upstream element-binding protein 2 isoform X2 [Ischnura elegans]|uniref:far upstream element-binding protein 2 isoform X2 n=1 Tax=Ischnura elegans TaxID=197161 RepID=UPI001ED8B13C|nr:far upstream element-binding protein 2 isoform X2 [Ischnura elegans]
MSDYSAVAPPQSIIQSSAFLAAVQRARQVAAKIQPSSAGESVGQKRPLEDGSGMEWTEPEAKKVAAVGDVGGSPLAVALRQQQAAAAAAAAVVAAAGAGSSSSSSSSTAGSSSQQQQQQPQTPPGGGGSGGPSGRLSLGGGGSIGGTQSEDIRVPDKMVGLIIGRGGEQISRLQNESGCKIQMAPDSGGMPDRNCTLTGSRDAIKATEPVGQHLTSVNMFEQKLAPPSVKELSRARELILNIVHQRSRSEGGGGDRVGGGGGGSGGGLSDMNMGGGNPAHVEIMVPGPKVGLIIGRGGETIKQLQEKSGAKMVVIQDGPQQEQEKPLRISGEPLKVEYAKQLVYDLIAEKEMQAYNHDGQNRGSGQGGPGGYNEYGGGGGGGGVGGGDSVEVAVPRAAVGVVIGKGGDMIKKIQNETGARVQFQQGRDDGPGERRCLLTGKPNQVEQARQRIEDLIDSVLQGDQFPRPFMRRDSEMGRGRGRGGGGGGPPPPPFDRMGGGRGGAGGGGQYGGGGWGERRPGGMQGGPGGPMGDKQEATFSVPAGKCGIIIGRGGETIKQINMQTGAHCELDRRPPLNPNEKVFVIRGTPDQIEHAKRLINEKIGMPPGPGGPTQPPTQYPGINPGPGPGGQQPPPQHYAPQGWGNAYQAWQNPAHPTDPNVAFWNTSQFSSDGGGQVQVNPQTGQPDYSIQWAEYYRSLGMHREAEMIEQQSKASKLNPQLAYQGMQPQPGQPQPQPGPGGPQPAGPQPGAPTAAQNGSPDYSAQWAEYYRSMGKIKEAEAIEAQMKAGKMANFQPGQPTGGPNPQQPGTGAQPGQPGPGAGAGGPAAGQMPAGQAYQPYGYPAAGYYGGGGQPAGGQPGGPQAQPYSYPNYGGYGGQPGGPENQ